MTEVMMKTRVLPLAHGLQNLSTYLNIRGVRAIITKIRLQHSEVRNVHQTSAPPGHTIASILSNKPFIDQGLLEHGISISCMYA